MWLFQLILNTFANTLKNQTPYFYSSVWWRGDFAWWWGGFLEAKLPGGEMTGNRDDVRDKASEKQYSMHFGNNIPLFNFFHVKKVTRMARTLARIVTRTARWLAHKLNLVTRYSTFKWPKDKLAHSDFMKLI